MRVIGIRSHHKNVKEEDRQTRGGSSTLFEALQALPYSEMVSKVVVKKPMTEQLSFKITVKNVVYGWTYNTFHYQFTRIFVCLII